MIKSLIKHDYKKMTEILKYFYLGSVIIAGITRLINLADHIQAIAIIGSVFAGLTYSSIASILINTFVHILKIFISNFYKDESYLTHTLPVSKNELIFSKYISSVLVVLSSVSVSVLSLFIMLYSNSFITFIKTSLDLVVSGFNMSVGLFLVLIIGIIFSQIFALVSMSLTATIKGNTYNHKKGIKGFGWFLVYYFGSMMATVMIVVVVFLIQGNVLELTKAVMSQQAFVTLLATTLILYVIYAFVFYFISKKLFNKGVNVD